MDIITSAVLGGIIYDSLKFGTYKFGGTLREKLKSYLFKNEELEVIEDIVEQNSLNKDTTIEEINSILSKSDKIQKILNNKNTISHQSNTLKDNYGAIVGNNSGEIKIDIKK